LWELKKRTTRESNKKMEMKKKEKNKSGRTNNKHQEKLWTCEFI
jgi:hypothetical protein